MFKIQKKYDALKCLGFDKDDIVKLNKKYQSFFFNYARSIQLLLFSCTQDDKNNITSLISNLNPSDENLQKIHAFLWIIAFEKELSLKLLEEKCEYLYSFNVQTAINRDIIINQYILREVNSVDSCHILFENSKLCPTMLLNCKSSGLPLILNHPTVITWYLDKTNSFYLDHEHKKYNDLMQMEGATLQINIEQWKTKIRSEATQINNINQPKRLSPSRMFYNKNKSNNNSINKDYDEKDNNNSSPYNKNKLWKLKSANKKSQHIETGLELKTVRNKN